MLEITGDLWNFHAKGHWIVIPTNGVVNQEGRAVMGKGVAKEAAIRMPGLADTLGLRLEQGGNRVYAMDELHLFTFPTKDHWREKSRPALIDGSARELVWQVGRWRVAGPIYLPRVGCGAGGLEWAEVKPVLAKALNDRFVVVSL